MYYIIAETREIQPGFDLVTSWSVSLIHKTRHKSYQRDYQVD